MTGAILKKSNLCIVSDQYGWSQGTLRQHICANSATTKVLILPRRQGYYESLAIDQVTFNREGPT